MLTAFSIWMMASPRFNISLYILSMLSRSPVYSSIRIR